MKFFCYLLNFIFLMQASYSVVISEIMADPVADETLNEWIELYNDENKEVNVSDWIIGDDNSNDTIEGGLYNNEGTIIPAFGYAIITDTTTRAYNNFNVSREAIRLYVDDASIGNGLGNNGETIYLYDNKGNIMDMKTYDKTSEDLSWAFINGSLFKSKPTPGYANDDSLTFNCDYAVEFILAKTVFENASEFSFKIRGSKVSGSSTNFTSRAKIEDLNGRLIREYKPFTNESITKQRTSTEYTPKLEGGKSYFMNSNITVECNETDSRNNFDSRIVTIKGRPLQDESSISIENVLDLGSDNKAKFGQTIRVRLNAYKGNTNKESIAIWVVGKGDEKISKQSKTNLELKYTNYSLTVPIQVKPNCNDEFDDGDYFIKAEGLDAKDEKEIEIEDIENSLCMVRIIETEEFSPKKFGFEIKDFNEIVDVGKAFNTKIVFDNNNNIEVPVKVWSYVYRGPKSYSGERKENMQEFILEANSLHEIELQNSVLGAEEGDYKFKVVVNKNNQKTNNEVILDIKISSNIETKDVNVGLRHYPDFDNDENIVTANKVVMPRELIYESTTEKARNLVPIFIIVLSVLINAILIWKR